MCSVWRGEAKHAVFVHFLKSKKLNIRIQFENICWCRFAYRWYMPSVPEFWPKMIYIFLLAIIAKLWLCYGLDVEYKYAGASSEYEQQKCWLLNWRDSVVTIWKFMNPPHHGRKVRLSIKSLALTQSTHNAHFS
jgi:hypothetical protein